MKQKQFCINSTWIKCSVIRWSYLHEHKTAHTQHNFSLVDLDAHTHWKNMLHPFCAGNLNIDGSNYMHIADARLFLNITRSDSSSVSAYHAMLSYDTVNCVCIFHVESLTSRIWLCNLHALNLMYSDVLNCLHSIRIFRLCMRWAQCAQCRHDADWNQWRYDERKRETSEQLARYTMKDIKRIKGGFRGWFYGSIHNEVLFGFVR